MKKWISLLLAAVMLLALAGCGGDSGSQKNPASTPSLSEDGGVLFTGSKSTGLGTVATPLNPEELYSSIAYVPEMFYGTHVFGGKNTSLDQKEKTAYIEQVGYSQIDPRSIGVEYGESVTAIPYAVSAGQETLSHVLSKIKDRNVACLYFLTDTQNLDYIYADYVISGNQIIFTPFLGWKYNESDNSLTYELSDVQLVYEFAFRGPALTLSAGGKSVTLTAKHFDTDTTFLGQVSDGYLKPGTKGLQDMTAISMFSNKWSMFIDIGDTTIYDVTAKLQEDGLMTLTWVDEENVSHTHQMLYFQCGFDGYVFADPEGTYCYTATWTEFRNGQLSDNISAEQIGALENLSDAQVEALVQKRADLVSDLAAACADSGLDVTVNTQTGEIALDAGVLFDVNQSSISPEGREFLKKFIGIYTSVVFNEKYDGFISQIMVEGHTDTNGAYDMNLDLSQRRADSVKDYCLSADCGITGDTLAALESTVNAVGYSYDYPIYDENGEVDMDASRRVSFRLLIRLTGE